MERKDLTIHDQVAVAAFELFLREMGSAPPPRDQEARNKWFDDLEARKHTLSPYTRREMRLKEGV